ncbi:hypothetical protein Mgra_00002781 [Meloidogyne graminicola]|uniref:Uncharacterized protein n=1 Tax=Meloidogyne graminicola TaxID=189291 RepID=A0A8S9ZWW2_9BILA|nr:hypothetical protein Mgra_00002781 [Meloidogyne graminicola]
MSIWTSLTLFIILIFGLNIIVIFNSLTVKKWSYNIAFFFYFFPHFIPFTIRKTSPKIPYLDIENK